MPTLNDNRTEANTNTEKAELLNTYFSEQSILDYQNHTLANISDPPAYSLSNLSISV